MRPRFLINLVNQCKSRAVNLRHVKITEEDILKGFSAYSIDIMTDIGYEIADVHPDSEEVLHAFLEAPSQFSLQWMNNSLLKQNVPGDKLEHLTDMLLWYGFLGLVQGNEDTTYIYSVNYNMKLLRGRIEALGERATFRINPAFGPALGMS